MLMIVQELRSPGPEPSKPANSRPRPRSMMFQERLLHSILVNMERVTDKALILWTSDNIAELLTYLQFERFIGIVKSARIDGFILICVASDWDCLLRLRAYMQDAQIREINFVSQVLVAENYYKRYFKDDEENGEKLVRKLEKEININFAKVDSKDFEEEEQAEKNILEKSAQDKLAEDNDFFLAYSEMGKSTLKEEEGEVKF